MMEKINYLLSSFVKTISRQGMTCPCCGDSGVIVERKYFFTALKRCKGCKLLFRCPTGTPTENKKYYQDDYKEGFTTELPTSDALQKMTTACFAGTPKDFSDRVAMLKALPITVGGKIIDFGCSWGYASWQFSQAGWNVQSFEISLPRGNYAREKLGMNVVSDMTQLRRDNDLFFSSHVLEHVPNVKETIAEAMKLVKKGGFFAAYTPNGSLARRAVEPRLWTLTWGLKHPTYLDEVFYKKIFQNYPFYITSQPIDLKVVSDWAKGSGQVIGNLEDGELLLIVKNSPIR